MSDDGLQASNNRGGAREAVARASVVKDIPCPKCGAPDHLACFTRRWQGNTGRTKGMTESPGGAREAVPPPRRCNEWYTFAGFQFRCPQDAGHKEEHGNG
jgi:hypothetical protein